ncbi:MAG: thiol peroxidase [Niabella sp.]
MSTVTFKGNEAHTIGTLPQKGEQTPSFQLTATDLSDKTLQQYAGKKLVLNIFPSIDTGVCAASVKKFNEEASGLENTVVLCISNDLPFALNRFCAAEGLNNVESLSAFRSSFGSDYGVTLLDSPLKNLLSRAVVTIDESGTVLYTQQVPEITQEPDYSAALASLK